MSEFAFLAALIAITHTDPATKHTMLATMKGETP